MTDEDGKLPSAPERPQNKNLRRGGGRTGPNKATREIRELAQAWTTGDPEWVESARARMKAGDAPHLENYLLQMLYGKPKDHDEGRPQLSVGTLNVLAMLADAPTQALRDLRERLLSAGRTDESE